MGGIALGVACVAGIAGGLPGVLAVAFAGAVLRVAGKVTVPWLLLTVVAAGIGALRGAPAPAALGPLWVDAAEAARGEVASGPLPTRAGQRFDVKMKEVRIRGRWLEMDTVACVSAPDVPELRQGDRVFLMATAERLNDLPRGLSNAFAVRGCTLSLVARSVTKLGDGHGLRHALDGLRRSLSDRLQAAVPGDRGSLLAGLVTGDDGALSAEARDAFVATGTTHITAVSGSNIALVVVFALAVGGRFGLHRRFGWQAVTAGGVWSYALLVGLQPPALRAALVATGAVFAASCGRRPDLVTLTVLAAAVELLWRPSDYWTLSFRLSIVSAVALALVVHGWGDAHLVKGGVVTTGAAQIATTPVLIAAFGRVSPLSLPANLVIAPMVAIAFPVAFVAGLVGLVSAPLGEAVVVPAALCSGAMLRAVDVASRIPGARVVIGTPGLVENAFVAAVSVSAVVLLSSECRRAIRRARSSLRAGDASTVALGGLGGLGFVIGLVVAAAR